MFISSTSGVFPIADNMFIDLPPDLSELYKS